MKIWHRVALGLLSLIVASVAYIASCEEAKPSADIVERFIFRMENDNNVGFAIGVSVLCAWFAIKPASGK